MEYINNEQNEINSNKYSVKCILVTVLILYLTWILNLLNIFIIDSSIFLICVIGSTIIALVTLILSKLLDLSKFYVKYIFIFFNCFNLFLYNFIINLSYYVITNISNNIFRSI